MIGNIDASRPAFALDPFFDAPHRSPIRGPHLVEFLDALRFGRDPSKSFGVDRPEAGPRGLI